MNQGTIKTWQERLRLCPSHEELTQCMEAEIADLRTALAARTGGERAAALKEAAQVCQRVAYEYGQEAREDSKWAAKNCAAAIRALAAQPAQQGEGLTQEVCERLWAESLNFPGGDGEQIQAFARAIAAHVKGEGK